MDVSKLCASIASIWRDIRSASILIVICHDGEQARWLKFKIVGRLVAVVVDLRGGCAKKFLYGPTTRRDSHFQSTKLNSVWQQEIIAEGFQAVVFWYILRVAEMRICVTIDMYLMHHRAWDSAKPTQTKKIEIHFDQQGDSMRRECQHGGLELPRIAAPMAMLDVRSDAPQTRMVPPP